MKTPDKDKIRQRKRERQSAKKLAAAAQAQLDEAEANVFSADTRAARAARNVRRAEENYKAALVGKNQAMAQLNALRAKLQLSNDDSYDVQELPDGKLEVVAHLG